MLFYEISSVDVQYIVLQDDVLEIYRGKNHTQAKGPFSKMRGMFELPRKNDDHGSAVLTMNTLEI